MKQLAFDLNIEWEELAGATRSAIAAALIVTLGSLGCLQAPADHLQRLRPAQQWPSLPPPVVQQTAVLAAFPDSADSSMPTDPGLLRLLAEILLAVPRQDLTAPEPCFCSASSSASVSPDE